MVKKAPKFWKKPTLISYLLLPLSYAYRLYLKLVNRKIIAIDIDLPIICVGNIIAGGAGKTPTALALADFLIKKGKKIAFVSKGYGGNFSNILKVDIKKHDANDVGDEALLLAQKADCYVCKSRIDGCKQAKKDGADVIILDDGLHDKSVKKDLSLMVIDGGYGFGNGMLLPSGPLRDTLENGYKQADIALIIGEDTCNIKQTIADSLPVISANIIISENAPDKSKKYSVFAGIGRPEKFFDTLDKANYKTTNKQQFPDHYPYKNSDIEKLLHQGSELLTTQKDWVRIASKYRDKIKFLPIELQWENESDITNFLEPIC